MSFTKMVSMFLIGLVMTMCLFGTRTTFTVAYPSSRLLDCRDAPDFPDDIPSCAICAPSFDSISSCAQAAPVLANVTQVGVSEPVGVLVATLTGGVVTARSYSTRARSSM